MQDDATLDRRTLFRLAVAATGALSTSGAFADSEPQAEQPWRIQRLSWAGVRIEGGNSSLFIDPWISTAIWDGGWTRPVVPIEASSARRAVIVTHLHNDHFDATAAKQALGETGIIIALDSMAATIASRGFRVRSVRLYQPEQWGDFVVIPVPAADGFGDEQVSWIVVTKERRIIHCGDTPWHGRFPLLGRAYGPFDFAFLPINGAIIENEPPRTDVPRTLTPRQAIVASQQLDAHALVPIHYGFSDATYREHAEALAELRAAAAGVPVTLRVVEEGSWL